MSAFKNVNLISGRILVEKDYHHVTAVDVSFNIFLELTSLFLFSSRLILNLY